jgi:glycosyltransferase involved in cell wall biosynthesis
MCQDAYNITKAMRQRGIDADLLITNKEPNVFSIPLWEDGEINGKMFRDPLNPNCSILEHLKLPEWIKIVNLNTKLGLLRDLDFLKELYAIFKNYDVIFAHVPASMYSMMLRCPYIPYDAGLIRYLPFSKNYLPPYKKRFYDNIKYQLLKKSYEKAKIILFTNPDTLRIFKEAKLRVQFVPFAIPYDRYAPKPKKGLFKNYDIVFFMPSRHHWIEKGNYKAIYAYKKFVTKHKNSLLLMVAWGNDLSRTKELINKLDIPSKNIKFVDPMPKKKLIDMFNESDVVLDQFTLGSWGTTTPEAMSCGKPVIMYYNKEVVKECFGSLPPILNAYTIDEIYEKMELCADPQVRQKYGVQGREWVKKNHNPSLVVDIHMKTAKELLRGN